MGLGDLFGNIPIVGGLIGGQSGGAQPSATPLSGGAYPGYPQTQGPTAYPGWPIPQPGPEPTYKFNGDFSQPGAAEKYQAQTQGNFTAPTASGGYWADNKDKFGAPGKGDQFWEQGQGMFNEHKANPVSQNAQGAYNQFQASAPADTSPYYDLAAKKLQNQMQGAAAASGMAGGSVARGQMLDSLAGLRGQEALANANYGLQRGQTAGNLASGADASSRGASQDQLGWMNGLGNLGMGIDQSHLAGLSAGMGAAGQADQTGLAAIMGGQQGANAAQAAARTRGQDYFGNQLQLGQIGAGIVGNTYAQQLEADRAAFAALQDARMGLPREQLNQSLNGRQSSQQGIKDGVGVVGSFMGGLGGM